MCQGDVKGVLGVCQWHVWAFLGKLVFGRDMGVMRQGCAGGMSGGVSGLFWVS